MTARLVAQRFYLTRVYFTRPKSNRVEQALRQDLSHLPCGIKHTLLLKRSEPYYLIHSQFLFKNNEVANHYSIQKTKDHQACQFMSLKVLC